MSQAPDAHDASIAELIPEFDRLAIDAMADWKVPGAALALVKDDKVALAKAHGQRDVEMSFRTFNFFTLARGERIEAHAHHLRTLDEKVEPS